MEHRPHADMSTLCLSTRGHSTSQLQKFSTHFCMQEPLSMMHGRDGDTKDTERRAVPVRLSGRTTCCFVLLWPPKGPKVASCREGLSRFPERNHFIKDRGASCTDPSSQGLPTREVKPNVRSRQESIYSHPPCWCLSQPCCLTFAQCSTDKCGSQKVTHP